MSRIKIHEFDPVIYPFKLWVIVSNRLPQIEDSFIDPKTNDRLDLSDVTDCSDAFICDEYVIHKESNNIGFLVVFNSKKSKIAPTVAHESSHLSDSIWKYLGEKKPGGEPKSYLIEWIVKSISEVK